MPRLSIHKKLSNRNNPRPVSLHSPTGLHSPYPAPPKAKSPSLPQNVANLDSVSHIRSASTECRAADRPASSRLAVWQTFQQSAQPDHAGRSSDCDMAQPLNPNVENHYCP